MKHTNWKIRGLALLGLALLWTFVGCATVDEFVKETAEKLPSWAKPSRSKPAYFFHKVRYSGETLSIIAEWYTGDVDNWRYLAKANPDLDPNRVSIGTNILIPKKLLHTRKRMPKDFVQAVAKRHKTRAAPVAKASPRAKSSGLTAAYHYHKVRYPGETLSLIAKWYTGDAENWRALTKANPRLDPNRIVVGNKIRIPKKLLHTKRTMPRNFIPGPATASKPKPSPDDIEVLELFGPK